MKANELFRKMFHGPSSMEVACAFGRFAAVGYLRHVARRGFGTGILCESLCPGLPNPALEHGLDCEAKAEGMERGALFRWCELVQEEVRR